MDHSRTISCCSVALTLVSVPHCSSLALHMFLLTRQAGYNEYGRPKYAYMHAATPQIVSEAPGTRSRTPRVLDQGKNAGNSNSTINDSKSSKGVQFNYIPYTSIIEASQRSSKTNENVIQEHKCVVT